MRPEQSPGLLLWQVATLWAQHLRKVLQPLGLTHAQFVLLTSSQWLVREQKGAVSQAQIAAHARADAVTTSEVLRTLARRKLVKRSQHPNDKRAWQIEPTPEGARLAQKALQRWSKRTRSSSNRSRPSCSS